MYKIELRRKAQRSLDKLPKDDFDAVIGDIKKLADSPRPRGVEKIKSAGLWRIRKGDYRIVYSIDDNHTWKDQLISFFELCPDFQCMCLNDNVSVE